MLGLKNQLKAELSETVVVTEGGVPKRVSKLAAMLKQMTARAVKGDVRAAQLIFAKLEKTFGTDDLHPRGGFTPEERDFWNAMQETLTFRMALYKQQKQREADEQTGTTANRNWSARAPRAGTLGDGDIRRPGSGFARPYERLADSDIREPESDAAPDNQEFADGDIRRPEKRKPKHADR